MNGRFIVAFAFAAALAASVAGCGEDGSDTEAGKQGAAILAKIKEVDQGIESATGVSTAIKNYESAAIEIMAFIGKYPETEETEELTKMLKWLEEEVARLKTVQEANRPPPDDPPDIYQ